jgi:polar amino acid transport system substrate-binding protein
MKNHFTFPEEKKVLSRRAFLSTCASGLVAVALGPSPASSKNKITLRAVYYENIPPYSFRDRKSQTMRGILVDLMQIVSTAAGYKMIHTGYPWARAQSMLITGKEDVFCCPPTNQRQTFAYFAPTPLIVLAKAQLFVPQFGRNTKAIQTAKTKSDLYKFHMVDFIGNSTGDAIWKNHPSRLLVSTVDSALKMLANQRIDFYFADPTVTRCKLCELNLQDKVIEVPADFITQGKQDHMCFGIRKTFPASHDIVTHVENVIQATITQDVKYQVINKFITESCDSP